MRGYFGSRRFAADVGSRRKSRGARSRRMSGPQLAASLRTERREWQLALAESLIRDDITLNPLYRALRAAERI